MSKIEITKDELTALLAEASSKAVEEAKVAFETSLKETAGKNKLVSYKGAFSNLSEDDQKSLAGKEKSASFIKALFHKDINSLSMFKSLVEGVGSAGGFIVPEEFAKEVNRVVEDFGLVAKLARKFPMKSDTLNVPRLSATVSVSYPGEANAGTPTAPVFESVTLQAKTLVGITPMSNELLADADISVVDLLVELFAEAIAGMLDNQGFNGTGSPFVGLLSDAGVTVVQPANGSGNSTFALASTPDNARDLISNVKPWSLQGASFIMHRTVWAFIQKSKASTGGDYFISASNPVLNGMNQGFPTAQAGTLWGYPVYLSDKMPSVTAVSTKFILFGNLKHLYVGMRQEIGVSISQDASIAGVNLFETNQSGVRVIARHALAVGLPSAFSVLRTSAS